MMSFFDEISWRHRGVLFKNTKKIGGVIVAKMIGDIRYGHIGIDEQTACFHDAQLMNIVDW